MSSHKCITGTSSPLTLTHTAIFSMPYAHNLAYLLRKTLVLHVACNLGESCLWAPPSYAPARGGTGKCINGLHDHETPRPPAPPMLIPVTRSNSARHRTCRCRGLAATRSLAPCLMLSSATRKANAFGTELLQISSCLVERLEFWSARCVAVRAPEPWDPVVVSPRRPAMHLLQLAGCCKAMGGWPAGLINPIPEPQSFASSSAYVRSILIPWRPSFHGNRAILSLGSAKTCDAIVLHLMRCPANARRCVV